MRANGLPVIIAKDTVEVAARDRTRSQPALTLPPPPPKKQVSCPFEEAGQNVELLGKISLCKDDSLAYSSCTTPVLSNIRNCLREKPVCHTVTDLTIVPNSDYTTRPPVAANSSPPTAAHCIPPCQG